MDNQHTTIGHLPHTPKVVGHDSKPKNRGPTSSKLKIVDLGEEREVLWILVVSDNHYALMILVLPINANEATSYGVGAATAMQHVTNVQNVDTNINMHVSSIQVPMQANGT